MSILKSLFASSIGMFFFALLSVMLVFLNAEYNLRGWRYTVTAILSLGCMLLSSCYVFKTLLIAFDGAIHLLKLIIG